MISQSKSVGLTLIGVAAVVLCLGAGPGYAGEVARTSIELVTKAPDRSVDMAPTGTLRAAGEQAVAASRSTFREVLPLASSLQRAEQADLSIRPELPPDADTEPPQMSPPPAIATRGDLRPAAKPRDEAPAKAVAISATSVATPAVSEPGSVELSGAADIESAMETMLNEDVKAKPVGARDWRSARIAIGAFYFMRGFSPVWTDNGRFTPAARAAIGRLNRARDDGLDLSSFALPVADARGLSPSRLAAADVVLSEAIVAYAIEASGGRIDPRSISPEITAKPDVADPFRTLTAIVAAGDPDAVLQNFNPTQKAYRELRDKLAQLRAESAPVAAKIPSGPILRIGMVDARVALIRARFALDALADSSNALVYDQQIASAVANFQRSNGLPASGILTANTVQALSGGSDSRQEAAIVANMEMWRWEPRDMGDERVEVNVPDFTLKVTQGDEIVHRARVIVGKPDTQTAIFSNQIKYLLVNPAWNVPLSIIKKEMMPKLANDPDYLTRAGFEVTQKGDTMYVRQPPGERNALGHILFMFPNEHSIYLHDTPSRGLFASQRRAFSHGCVRVDDPMRLGELVMGGAATGWSQARLRGLVGSTERTIFLPHPLAIHIEYFTAFVDDDGALQMREDIYGHTRRVETALGLAS
jgi:L,D-transpeptidase YcbB